MESFRDIENASYIVLKVKEESLIPVYMALYGYMLQLHKKAAVVCSGFEVDTKWMFLPWSKDIKLSEPKSADFIFEKKLGCVELFAYFKNNKVKINKKMATALYAALLIESDRFSNIDSYGTIFAVANELIRCGAEDKRCFKEIYMRHSLSDIRLKGIMFSKMVLKNNATHAEIILDDSDLLSCGARLESCKKVMDEILSLPYLKSVSVIDTNSEIKILKKRDSN